MTRNPYQDLPKVPSFDVTSTDIADGVTLPNAQVSGLFGVGGRDVSPQLSWSGFPAATKSFAVTVYDPDAPSASGWWHWIVADIPATVTTLPAGAGDEVGSGLPAPAFQLKPDGSQVPRYVGAAPPPGHGPHHYYTVVHALDVETLGIDETVSPGVFGMQLFMHTLARGMIVPVYEIPG
jgi:Raf kinase inhibitor-like YbhB/YbcL family protein